VGFQPIGTKVDLPEAGNHAVGGKFALIRRREDAMAGQAPALSPEERENHLAAFGGTTIW
jgi:hypothetical protein